MKLENRGAARRSGRARSADIMRPAEEMPERIFDPRLDLGPGVYEELRETVERTAPFLGPRIFKIPRLSWISWFDPSYRDDLRGVGQYKDRQFHKLEREAELAKVTIGNLVELNRSIAYFLQEFPDARPEIEGLISKEELGRSILASSGEGKEDILKDRLVPWLQIWPQERAAIIKRFFPEGVDTVIADPHVLNSWPRPTERIHYAAQIMLAFPEHREHLIKLVEPYVKRIHGVLTTLGQSIRREDFNEYHQLIGDLTIIGAKSAVIDQAGIIQVELQPLSKPTPPTPLPDRSTL